MNSMKILNSGFICCISVAVFYILRKLNTNTLFLLIGH